MDSNSRINNVQSFVKGIGDNDSFWRLLLGRDVIDSSGKRGRVSFLSDKGVEISVHYQINVLKCYGFNHGRGTYVRDEIVKYEKEKFIKEFNKIEPPLSYNQILKLIQAEEREAVRQALLKNLKKYFEQDFLNAYNLYQTQCFKHISFDEYQAEKSNYVRSWIQRHLNPENLPDPEQAAAIGAVEGHVQVVARSGSGKTSTLVNRALFLQKHCGIAPSEMLLLAFNRKAVEDIQKKLSKQLQGSMPYVMTFHALAYALVYRPENQENIENILFDEPDGEQSKSRALQEDVIDGYLCNPYYYEKIRALMMAHFREDWERIVLGGYDKSPEEMLLYRRSLPREGLDGTYLKSFGEKAIADFLFEHDIKYKYERNFWWHGINYRPDFTIENNQGKGIVIEYFGLQGDPDYDADFSRQILKSLWARGSSSSSGPPLQ
jgi:DNA helicase-4